MSRNQWFIAIIAMGLTTLGFWLGTKVHYDFQLKTLTSEESEDYKNFEEYNKEFPFNAHAVTVAFTVDGKPLNYEKMVLVDSLANMLQQMKGVQAVNSLTTIKLAEKTAFGSRYRGLVSLQSPEKFNRKWERIHKYTDVTPKFLSRDRTATSIYVRMKYKSDRLLGQIEQAVDSFKFKEVHYAGRGQFDRQLKDQLSVEALVLPFVAIFLLIILFYLFFRDFRSLFATICVLLFNIALIQVLFWWLEIPVGPLTQTVPLLIVVLSFCDIVHVIYKYKTIHFEGPDRNRLKRVMKTMRFPLWLTSITTFIAFAILLISPVKEIGEFAVISSLGILGAYLSARVLLPVYMLLFRIKPFKGKKPLDSLVNTLVSIQRRSKLTSALAILVFLVLIALAGFNSKIDHKTSLKVGLDTPIGASLQFFDKHFEGTRSIEVILKDTNVMTTETMQVVDSIENYLRKTYGCRSVFSLNTSIKRLNRYKHFGLASYYRLPDSLDASFKTMLNTHGEQLGLVNAMTSDQKLIRIVGRLPDIGLNSAHRRNNHLKTYIASLESGTTRQVFVSGFSYVHDQSLMRITELVLLGIALSLITAFAIITLIFRSIRLSLVALMVNGLPVVAALVLIHFMGIGLQPSTAIALSIILGLSLDDTIYLLAPLYKDGIGRLETKSIELSTRQNSFPAMVTSLILASGFLILSFSGLQSNQNMGTLVAIILIIAVISDLIILPALLKQLIKKRSN